MKKTNKLKWLVLVAGLLLPQMETYSQAASFEVKQSCDNEDPGDQDSFE
ncbi:MAG: hypothetical protein AAGH72_13595 [Verrucomicrobiota bacterium]